MSVLGTQSLGNLLVFAEGRRDLHASSVQRFGSTVTAPLSIPRTLFERARRIRLYLRSAVEVMRRAGSGTFTLCSRAGRARARRLERRAIC